MFTVYNSIGVPVYQTSDELEAQFVSMCEDGYYIFR